MVKELRDMSKTRKKSSGLSNPLFISSSNVLKLVAISAMTLLLSSLINIQTADAQVYFGLKFGTYGSGDGQFNSPKGVAVDSTGKIYVADMLNYRIQVFSSNGTFLFKFGTYGSGDGQFDGPYGVAVDSTGKIYVSDLGNSRIEVFSAPAAETPEP